MDDLNNPKRGQARLFYLVVFLISILLVIASAYDVFAEGSRGDKAYEALMTEFSVALLIIVTFVMIRRFGLFSEKNDEILGAVQRNTDKIDRLESASTAMLAFSETYLADQKVGKAFVNRADYYEEYYRLVREATTSIKLVGDGFRCHDAKNEHRALGFYNALKTACSNGVVISRFQYHNTLSVKWLRLLQNLLDENCGQENFRLYMDKSRDPTTVPYVICLTDPQLDNASVNIMFTMNADTQLEEKLGGPAFIFQNASESTQKMDAAIGDYFLKTNLKSKFDMERLIDDTINTRKEIVNTYIAKNAVKDHNIATIKRISRKTGVPDIELIDQCLAQTFSIERVLYFAYGSNLQDTRIQVANRAPSSVCIDRGFIKDYELCFNIRGVMDQGKGGGVANIRPCAGARVYGALYLIDRVDYDRLEQREHDMGYTTFELTVDKQGFGEVPAKVFVTTTRSTKHYSPTTQYAEFITTGMANNMFPAPYQKSVNAMMASA